MINSKVIVFIFFFSAFCSNRGYGQEVFTHDVPFGTSSLQSMWGPDGINLGINNTWDIFPTFYTPTLPINFGVPNFSTPSFSFPGVGTWGPWTFGANMSGSFGFGMGATFSLQNFTLGQVNVDYPIQVKVTAPANLSYDQGDQIDIETEYKVVDGWALDSYYPNPGNATLTLNIYTQLQLTFNACFFECFPPLSVGSTNYNQTQINLIDLDFNILDGDGMDATFIDIPSLGFANPAIEVDIPDTLYTSMINNDPLGDYGLSGWFTPPMVVTDDTLQLDQDLRACGESQYFHSELEIFDLLSNLPVPYASVLSYLSDSYTVGPVTFSWTLFSAWFQVGIYNKQCFDFEPKVWGKYLFDVPIEYEILDSLTNAPIGPSDVSNIIEVELGNTIRMKYPCYKFDLEVEPSYSIDGYFTSHTYDSIPLDFCYKALEFSVTWSDQTLIPGWSPICMPGITGWSCGWCDCLPCFSSCAWQIPGYSGLSVHDLFPPPPPLGPLVPTTCLPIASFNYDWVPPETWLLDGFSEYSDYPPFHLLASELGVSNTQQNVLCYGDNTGSIDVTFSAVSPATPYTYEWSNGQTIQNISNLEAGPYELSAYDANECQLFTGATILEPQSPVSVIETVRSKSCRGGIDDGEIDLFIQGGTPPYNVSWDNGMNGESIIGLAAGTYTATITDLNNCVRIEEIEVGEPNSLGQVGIVTDANCFESEDGSIQINSYGGSLPYTYSWSSGQITEDLTNIPAGVYTLTVTDVRGCESTETYEVYQPLAPLSLGISGVDILCKGDSTGSIDLSVSGGTMGYEFEWINSNGLILPYATEDLSNLPADDYTVEVKDNNGCTAIINQTLIEPNAPLVSSPLITNVLCNGNATGEVDPIISGGTAGYTYAWSNGSNSSVLSGITAGIYSLDVIDANNCRLSEIFEIQEPTPLTLQKDSLEVLCFGESTGTATIIVNGGVPGYSYLWSDGQNTATAESLSAGTYSVIITDQHGCSENASIIISQPVTALSAIFDNTMVDCHGNETGMIDMEPVGGTSPYYFNWSTSGYVLMVDTTEDLSSVPAGEYLVDITDENGCEYHTSTLITEPSATISITGILTNISCNNGSDGIIDITVNGGTPNYSYSWDTGETSEDINMVIAGDHVITVTDANSCVQTQTFTLTEPELPLSTYTSSHHVSCLGMNDGYIESFTEGGTEPYVYLWSNGDETANSYNLYQGTYSITVTDANGCTAFSGGVVNEPQTGIELSYSVSNVSCFGGNDGYVVLTASGGTQPYEYNWGTGESIQFSDETDTLDLLEAASYILIVTDANGCQARDTAVVSEPTIVSATHEVVDVLCDGEPTGEIDVTPEGGTPPYSFNWSNGATTEDVTDLYAGWYFYDVLDNNNCIYSDSAEILQPPPIWITADETGISCRDEEDGYIVVDIGGGVGPYELYWSNGGSGTEIYDLAEGEYYLIYVDANGCTSTVYYQVLGSTNSCIDVPNAFSPDGDNYNDTWFIENLDLYPNMEMIVFNKWGNEIYRNKGEYIPWDGTVNNKPLPSDVYYFILSLNNEEGEKFAGTITIVR